MTDRLTGGGCLRSVRDLALGVIIFTIAATVAFRYFGVYHKSLVWDADGVAQHFTALYYLNQIVRAYIHNRAAGFPFWSWQLGLGADTIGTLSFYAVGDPFAPISLLFPMHSMETAYAFAYGVRIAFAGLASWLYLRKMGARPFSATLGSIVYCFTMFTLFSTTHHPLFGTALALFPLLLLGAEYALERRHSWLLVVAVLLAAMSNFYFFYMEALTLALYVVARYFELTPKERRWRSLIPSALRMAGLMVLGMLLAAPLLFPSIAAVFSTARRSSPFDPALLFSAKEYGHFVVSLVADLTGPNFTVLGFLPLGFLVIPAVFMRRGNTALKAMLVAFPIIMMSPVLSATYNGFTFPTGRYGFEWALFMGLAVALMLSDNTPFSGWEILGMGAWYAALWDLVFGAYPLPVSPVLTVPCAIGAATWAVFALEWLVGWIRRRRHDPQAHRAAWAVPFGRWIVVLLLLASVYATSVFTYDAAFGNNLVTYLDAGKVMDEFTNEPGQLASTIKDSSFYRVQDSNPPHYNEALVQGLRSTAFYYSIMNADLTSFISENDIRSGWSSFSYNGFDDRAAIDELLAVKYYTADRSQEDFVPYGYDLYSEETSGDVYSNRFALPLGFVYDRTLDATAYAALPVVARQQAMLEGALLDTGTVPPLPSVVPTVTVIDVPVSITPSSGVEVDTVSHRITRLADNSRIKLQFAAPPGAELYVQLSDVDDVPSTPLERKDYLIGTHPSAAASATLAAEDAWFVPPLRTDTFYSAGGPAKPEKWELPESPYYWGQHSQLVNLGYRRTATKTATMHFVEPGTLTYGSLDVLAVPMADYAARATRLRSDPMRSIHVANNVVTGETDSPKAGLLFLSIPYSSGWSATVDGRPAATVRVNTAFIGIPVSAGKHAVALHYTTPGLLAGLRAAAAALALSVLLIAIGVGRALWRRFRPAKQAE